MKRSPLSIMLLLAGALGLNSFSQGAGSEKSPATKLESFLVSKGELIVKDFYAVGNLMGNYGTKVEITCLILYTPGEEDLRIKGVKIEITERERYGEKDESSFLDIDEVISLSKALDYINNTAASWKLSPREYSEVVFSTKGDFKIGFYQSGVKQNAFCKSGYITTASCFFPTMQSIMEVKGLIDNAIEILNLK